MIGFIVLGLMGIGALSDAIKKKSPSIPSSRPDVAKNNAEAETADTEAARINFEQMLKDWRAAWERTINRTQWIESDTVARIQAAYPPAGLGLSSFSTTSAPSFHRLWD